MKDIAKLLFVVLLVCRAGIVAAQGVDGVNSTVDSVVVQPVKVKQEPVIRGKQLIDGVVAVVGNNIILRSDFLAQQEQLVAQGAPAAGADCYIWKELLFQKLLVHHAEVDSVPLTEKDVDFEIDRRLQYMLSQMGGSHEEFKKQFGKSVLQFKQEVRPLIKESLLARKMQAKISSSVMITPKEVEVYYKRIPKDSLPIVEEQYKVAQIIIQPRPSQYEKDRVRKELAEIREEIIKGKDFGLMALLHSQDPGSKMRKGELGYVSKDNLVPAFSNAAMRLQPGEISEIVESEYGFHVIQLIGKKGTYINVRHILLSPKVYSTDVELAKLRVDSVLKEFGKGKVTFNRLASEVSDDIRTKNNGGVMMNYANGKDYFPVRDLDEDVYFQIQKLKVGETGQPEIIALPGGKKAFRIIQLMDKIPFHVANIEEDYTTIKDAALLKKKEWVVAQWVEEKVNKTYTKLPAEVGKCDALSSWSKKTAK